MFNRKSITNSFIYIIALMLLFLSIFFTFNPVINLVSLYVLFPSITLLLLVFYPLPHSKYLLYYILVCLCIFIATPFSSDFAISLAHLKKILGCFLLSFILTYFAQCRYYKWIYLAYVFFLIVVWYYTIFVFHLLSTFSAGTQRLGGEIINPNMFSYYTFYFSFSVLILSKISTPKLSKLYNILLILSIPLSLVTALYTGSRQILVLLIPFILTVIYFKYFYHKSFRKNIFIYVFALILLLCFVYQFKSSYTDSLLATRFESSFKEDSRSTLLLDAVSLGVRHPLLGVGPGTVFKYTSTGNMSHNSFTELFAGSGFLSLCLYLAMIFSFLSAQFKRYKKTKDIIFVYFLIFGIFWFIYQFFYIFYISMWLISFFIFVASNSNYYYKTHYK